MPGLLTRSQAADLANTVTIWPEGTTRDYMQERCQEYAEREFEKGTPAKEITIGMGGLYSEAVVRRWHRDWEEWRGQSSRHEPLPNSYILGLFGPRGSGKTLRAAHLCWEYYLQGRPVFFNPRGLLHFPPMPNRICEFLSLREFVLKSPKLKGAVYLADETQVNLSKYRASSTAAGLQRQVLQQTRKLGLDLLATSNSPNELDPSFPPQLNLHGHCKAYMEPDYPGRDEVWTQWVDTHRRWGKGATRSARGTFIDDRIRVPDYIYPASDVFDLFDTNAQADPFDVMGLTADEVRGAQAEQAAGMTIADLVSWVKDVLVPKLVVEHEVATVQVAPITTWIAERYNNGWDHQACCGAPGRQETGFSDCRKGQPMPWTLAPEFLGRAFVAAGLVMRKKHGQQLYHLPTGDGLAKWQQFGEMRLEE